MTGETHTDVRFFVGVGVSGDDDAPGPTAVRQGAVEKVEELTAVFSQSQEGGRGDVAEGGVGDGSLFDCVVDAVLGLILGLAGTLPVERGEVGDCVHVFVHGFTPVWKV